MTNVKTRKNNKGIIIIGALGLGALGLMLLKKKASADDDIIPSGEITWEGSWQGYAGIPVVVEGSSASAIVTVTNASRSNGVLCDYQFKLQVVITDEFGHAVAQGINTLNIGAGSTVDIQIPFRIIPGYFGSMKAMARLFTTDGGIQIAATDMLDFDVAETTATGAISLLSIRYWDNTRVGAEAWSYVYDTTPKIAILGAYENLLDISIQNTSGASLDCVVAVCMKDIANLDIATLYLVTPTPTATLNNGDNGFFRFAIPELGSNKSFFTTVSVISGYTLLARDQFGIDTI